MEISLFFILRETFLRITNLILSSLTLDNCMRNCAASSIFIWIGNFNDHLQVKIYVHFYSPQMLLAK